MIISGHQPNYLPWLGYFHKMLSSDLFVITDDVTYSNKIITNKNRIKGPEGARLLSVPTGYRQLPVKDVKIVNDGEWNHKHWGSLQVCYGKTPYWKKYRELFEPVYANPSPYLAELNLQLIDIIRDLLEIKTPMVRASELKGVEGAKGTRVINLCRLLGADIYLSGLGARSYNDQQEFANSKVRLCYQEFTHPVYPQRFGGFIPNLSAVDLLFNCGSKSKDYLTKQVIL